MRTFRTVVIFVLCVLLASFGLVYAQDLAVFNGDFELLPEGVTAEEALGKTPYGWSASIATAPTIPDGHISASLTDAKVFSGKFAVRLYTNDAASILLSSRPIPIQGGLTYAALFRIFDVDDLATNHTQAYMEFWADDQGWWGHRDFWSEESWREQTPGGWGTSKRLSAVWAAAKSFNTWEEVIVMADAPANAKYVTLSLWIPRRPMHTYIDEIQLAVVE
ncbi:MAG TPA: hypothetical protein GXZ82_01220 [Firmicutes bacterium]|jgi:hypothetical protein|nr:hypothetical protein [Bacillota bacterium]